MATAPHTVRITRQSGYRFLVDFGPAMAQWAVDEPPPLGQGSGPSPDQLLMAAVANCLAASLTFALQKFKEDPGTLEAEIQATIERNPQNRLRIEKLAVNLRLGVETTQLPHLERALAQFEEFCTVSMSVKQGIAIEVAVSDVSGMRLR